MNISEEDYLKYIYKQEEKNNKSYVSTTELSQFFGYRLQSIIEMLKRLQEKDLLIYLPYKGAALTSDGNEKARMLVSSHRLWEYFLTNELKLDKSLVHKNAEILEHATSQEVLVKLYEYLGKPERCPHGQLIPKI